MKRLIKEWKLFIELVKSMPSFYEEKFDEWVKDMEIFTNKEKRIEKLKEKYSNNSINKLRSNH